MTRQARIRIHWTTELSPGGEVTVKFASREAPQGSLSYFASFAAGASLAAGGSAFFF
jgi:hypothetical protein